MEGKKGSNKKEYASRIEISEKWNKDKWFLKHCPLYIFSWKKHFSWAGLVNLNWCMAHRCFFGSCPPWT